jgi:hypothetical protein
MVDLGDFKYGDDLPVDDRPVDDSGKPAPCNAFACCSNGNDIPLSVVYKGTQTSQRGGTQRVYRLVLEGHWTPRLVETITRIKVDDWKQDDIALELKGETHEDDEAIYRMLAQHRIEFV